MVSETGTHCPTCGEPTGVAAAPQEAPPGPSQPPTAGPQLPSANPSASPAAPVSGAGPAPASVKPVNIGLGVLVALVLIISGSWYFLNRQTIVTPSGQQKYTMAQFNQVQNGMTLQQVEGILGPGTPSVQGETAGISGAIYEWQNDDGSNMNVQFQNGLVIMKAQAGLR